MADGHEIPDRAKDKPLEGLSIDKLNAERLNEKNRNRLDRMSMHQYNRMRPERELDILDREISKSQSKFQDSLQPVSRYGGIKIGEHQINYSS